MKPQHTQTYGTQWKAFLRGKLMAFSASKKKLERAHTSTLTTHLKALEQKEANSPRRSGLQEIIKLRGEINQVERRRTIQRFNQMRIWFFEKINKIDKPLARLTKGHREYCLCAFTLVSLAKGLSIVLIFSKNQLLVWLILCVVLFVSTWLISALSLIISCSPLLFGEFASFCSVAFRCVVKLLLHVLSSFFFETLRAMSFLLRTAFIVSHMFGYVVTSLNSKKSLVSFFISSLTKVSLSWVFFSFHMNVGFLLFMLLLKISLSLWWSGRMHGVISIFFYLLRPLLWPIIWSILEKVPWGAEKKVYPFVLG